MPHFAVLSIDLAGKPKIVDESDIYVFACYLADYGVVETGLRHIIIETRSNRLLYDSEKLKNSPIRPK